MTDISQFYFVSPYPFEASSHAGFPFSVNHLPCFCDNYITFAPFCQQESTVFVQNIQFVFCAISQHGFYAPYFPCPAGTISASISLVKNVFHNFIHFSTYAHVESSGKGRTCAVLPQLLMISAESSRTVNGPSLHSSTCISAPNMPDSTTGTRSRQYALHAS